MFKKIGVIYKESLSFDKDISPHIETVLSHSKELYFHESADSWKYNSLECERTVSI